MTTIVTRAGKGSPLTNNEVDSNFTNLNGAKIETLTSTDSSVTVTGTGSSRDLTVVRNDNATGVLAAPSITITGSGSTVDVGSTTANLHSVPLWAGTYATYTIPAATGLALTDNSANYLVVSYNSGSPAYSITTNPSAINGSDVIGATLLWRSGTEVHYQPINWGLATAARLNRRAVQTNRYERASGVALGETTGRVITIGSGVIWYGVNEYAETAQTSASSNAEFYYHSSGAWTKSTVSTYNNTQYDNGTNLVTLSGAGTQYAVNWVYRYLDGDGLPKIAYILGSGNYSLAQAVASAVPTPPPILSTMAILVGRIIVAQNASTATQIDSAFTQVFSSTSVTSHNDLSGLQGGTTDEYYHLTSAQYTVATQAATTSVSGYLTATDWNTFNNKSNTTGTVTSVSATAGTGISISGSPITTSGTLTITNTAPDQTVALTASTGISVTGAYPNFTITNTAPNVGSGTVTSVSGTGTASGLSLSGTVTSSGNITLSGTVNSLDSTASYTAVAFNASSDEQLKTNWAGVSLDFVARLSDVKHGTFERINSGIRDAGVSAQSLQKVLPEAVVQGEDGYLAVNYGGAALVAAIELAKVVQELRAEIAMLKAKVGE